MKSGFTYADYHYITRGRHMNFRQFMNHAVPCFRGQDMWPGDFRVKTWTSKSYLKRAWDGRRLGDWVEIHVGERP